MDIAFVKLDNNGYCRMLTYSVSDDLKLEIKNNLKLQDGKEYTFAFESFIEFEASYHGKALIYLFKNTTLSKHITTDNNDSPTLLTENNIAYTFNDIKNVKQNLDKNQMLFLCAILHNLNMQSYLAALIPIMMNDFKMKFDDIKQYTKSDKLKMKVYCKEKN